MQTENYVAIGGLVSDDIRQEVAQELRNRLPDSKDVVWRHSEMKYEGSKRSNVVNWITKDQASGLQIEMTPVTAYRFRKRVAKAVVEVYDDLMK